MKGKRSYAEGCAAAHALDLVGERWALLVVRELIFGPKRFTDLRASLPLISPNVLTQRLTDLERAGVLRRHKLPRPAAAWVYELTPWGAGLEPILMSLGRWALHSPAFPEGKPMSADALMLSLRTMFSAPADFAATIELRVDDDAFTAAIADGRLSLTRGTTPAPDATITADTTTLASLVYGGASLRASGAKVTGDGRAARGFLRAFASA
ncbi:MAG: helix-turn-helix transcriptional regulator [Acidobacteria bacterium]|nr:helix-turn-helix transcriptional regulator [Acidobacteriota bacterium]